ncbi:hypothetical protein ASC66_14155 [Leifsonia sp. Root4]|nr:hypothetical protein ASC66_14155 [Leifsonia sp. Root4]
MRDNPIETKRFAARELARFVRWDYFPVAFIGRLPFAMTIVGVLTLVAGVRGSIADAGLAAASAGIATAIFGTMSGGLADRFGQRWVLLSCSALNACAMLLFVWLSYSAVPAWGLAVGAALVGASVPQVGPFSRSRMAAFAGALSHPRRDRALSMVMSYESVADEASFVLGPVLVGLLASLIAPWAPLVVAAAVTASVVVAFATHPSATASTPSHARTVPPGRLFTPQIMILAVAMFLVGGIFGSTLTALTAFMHTFAAESQTGILYGAMSVGAILSALGVAALPARFTIASRWLVFSGIAVLGVAAIVLATTIVSMAVALFITGVGVGAVLVSLFTLGSQAAMAGRSTVVLTMLQSSLTVGQALVTAAVGLLVEANGAHSGFLITAGVAAALTLLAVAGRRQFGSR